MSVRLSEPLPYGAQAVQCLERLPYTTGKTDSRNMEPAELANEIDFSAHVSFAGARTHDSQHARVVDTEDSIAAKAQQL
jgi:hypothetical protein